MINLLAALAATTSAASRSLSLTVLLPLIVASTATTAATISFEDVTARAGMTFKHTIGDEELSSLVEATGAGCAFLDYDNDGWLDLFLVNGVHLPGLSDPNTPNAEALKAATSRLFRNRGQVTFEDVTKKAGILPGGYGLGVVVADYNNDGFADLYQTCYGPNRLYRNNGDGTFTDVAKDAGVDDPRFSVGAVFFDYNLDGRLDLFVGNYIRYDHEYNQKHGKVNNFPGPLAYPPDQDQLYRNEGNGTFTNATREAGLAGGLGRAMGCGSFDYDDDGWPDIFVANDAMENHLHHNERNGQFRECGLLSGAALGANGNATGAMGLEVGDVNGDSLLDFYVPDFTQSCLYLNLGKGLFEDRALQAGIVKAVGKHIKWGAALADFDLDGSPDLFVALGDANSLTGYADHLLLNDGKGHFTDVSASAGPWFKAARCGRGVACGDFDNDGQLDLLVLNLNDPPALLRNTTPPGERHWLKIRLVGRASNRDGIGARVRCVLPGKTLVRERTSAGSYCSSHDPRVHFGLGTNQVVPELEIRWPSGKTQRLSGVKADQLLTVQEPGGNESDPRK